MVFIILAIVAIVILYEMAENKYKKFEAEVLEKLGLSGWNIIQYCDAEVTVKSRQALEKYDDIKYFKENREELAKAERVLARKSNVERTLNDFLENNEYPHNSRYRRLEKQINSVLNNTGAYRIHVRYISTAGNCLGEKILQVSQYSIKKFNQDPSLLMGKTEYNRYLKEQHKEALDRKYHEYYSRVNAVIDYANASQGSLVIKGSKDLLDRLIAQLFDRTVNNIKKIK